MEDYEKRKGDFGEDNSYEQYYVFKLLFNTDPSYYKDLYDLPAEVTSFETWYPYWGADVNTLGQTRLLVDCANNDYGYGFLLSEQEKDKQNLYKAGGISNLALTLATAVGITSLYV